MANLELPRALVDVHPEAHDFIQAVLAHQEAATAKEAREAQAGKRESSTVLDPEKHQEEWTRARHGKMVDIVASHISPEERRDLAGRMIAKILDHGIVMPSPAPAYATIQRATYHGTSTIADKPYYWTTALEAWHWSPAAGGDQRVLSFDEQVARRAALLQDYPHAGNSFMVATASTLISQESYPIAHRVLEGAYSQVRVDTDAMYAYTIHERVHEHYPTIAVALTPERIAEIGAFIDALQPDETPAH